ncbi:cell wall-binding repeat-containing protein [Salana multivorans]
MSVSSRRLLGIAASVAVLAAAAAPASALEIIPRNGSAQTVGQTRLIRLDSDTRQGTALSIAQAGQFPQSGTVLERVALLAASADFPDALAAAPLATALSAPVLLTQADGSISAAVMDQLASYDTVIVVSGSGLVPDSTLGALRGRGVEAVRYAGATRYDTAAALALATLYWDSVVNFDGTSPQPSIEEMSIYLADGLKFPDALAAGPVASSEENGIVLLTSGGALPSVTAAAVNGNFGAINGVDAGVFDRFQAWWSGFETKARVQTVGGAARDAARSGGVNAIYDLVGSDRYETAAKVAQFGRNRAVFGDDMVLASGQKFADGVVGGALGGNLSAPLLLTRGDGLPAVTRAQIAGRDSLDVVVVVGGEGSVSSGVVDQVAEILPR